ncbi:MAG: laccase [Burkholderiales bacterium PBB4]|nr:MAG: laccase [Burkholderiales bacterium PBB4]
MPDWPAPPGVRAVCTTRAGGVSGAPFSSLNLGLQVGDEPGQVMHNRQVLQGAVGYPLRFVNQVHGTAVWRWNPPHEATVPVADAVWSDAPGQACAVMVADCLPLLLCSTDGAWIAAAHAGWRGLAGQGGVGILESVFEAFLALQPMDSAGEAPELIAWLGPCIGPQAFEVGPEVRAAFVEDAALDADMDALNACFAPQAGGKYLAHLPQLARLRLQALGLWQIYGNDGSRAWCTVSNPSDFFSYRRDRTTGRMAACIWRD